MFQRQEGETAQAWYVRLADVRTAGSDAQPSEKVYREAKRQAFAEIIQEKAEARKRLTKEGLEAKLRARMTQEDE